MMTGDGDDLHAVGGPARHIPVLLGEVLEALSASRDDVVIDGTFGAGGYTRAILETGASVIAIDRDLVQCREWSQHQPQPAIRSA
ncbi:MAG: 16S rRNA (cytosine(1402)-N(4))-methyltransferase, partial [Mesorhizobium sp.]|nr:16S rRNA (cytosine(1402)-N(4))-methyltransferase [Mesorhizobium sp.]